MNEPQPGLLSDTRETFLPDWARGWVLSLAQAEVRSALPVRSAETNQVFRLETGDRSLVLKLGPNLEREYDRLRWLEGRLLAPQPVGFTTQGEVHALLMSAIEGEDLADLAVAMPPQVILTRLAEALQTLHATPIGDWPFGGKGTVLVHGDACLPNFLYVGDVLSGYIDLGDMTVGTPEIDLAAGVWSLQYNLGPGHGLAFLHAYGLKDVDEGEVERLRRMYEQ